MPLSLASLLQTHRDARALPLIMGIVNVTPDSFSDGGQFFSPDTAIAHARQLIEDGADILDIGAESTRPYGDASEVSASDEHARLAPVLEAIIALGKPVSIDTMKAEVADWALTRGAAIANDVWGLQRDSDMARVVARHGAPVIVMHNRHDVDPAIDIVAEMKSFFARSVEIARQSGIAREQIALDPGIGFGKTVQQSIEALARMNELLPLGFPLLIGASRKRFIAHLSPAEPQQRLGGTIASHLFAADFGAAIVRVHDVAQTAQAMRVRRALHLAQRPHAAE